MKHKNDRLIQVNEKTVVVSYRRAITDKIFNQNPKAFDCKNNVFNETP